MLVTPTGTSAHVVVCAPLYRLLIRLDRDNYENDLPGNPYWAEFAVEQSCIDRCEAYPGKFSLEFGRVQRADGMYQVVNAMEQSGVTASATSSLRTSALAALSIPRRHPRCLGLQSVCMAIALRGHRSSRPRWTRCAATTRLSSLCVGQETWLTEPVVSV